jgi:hypothetical protein
MRLQDIVQSLFQCVVGLSISRTVLVRRQVQGRTGRLVLGLPEACNIAKQVQEIRRHRNDGEADELPEQVLAVRRAAGLHELLDVLQSKRIGRDIAALAVAMVVAIIVVPAMVVVIIVTMVMVIAIVVMVMVAIPTGGTGRASRAGVAGSPSCTSMPCRTSGPCRAGGACRPGGSRGAG